MQDLGIPLKKAFFSFNLFTSPVSYCAEHFAFLTHGKLYIRKMAYGFVEEVAGNTAQSVRGYFTYEKYLSWFVDAQTSDSRNSDSLGYC